MMHHISQNIDLLAQALVAFQAELKPAIKDGVNPHFKSSFATLESIMEVRPLLFKHGLSLTQYGGLSNSGNQTLISMLLHKSGQWISGEYVLLNAKPNDPQSQGSSMTYARRYCAAAILGITTDGDDDGEAASDKQAKASGLQGRLATKPEPKTGYHPFDPNFDNGYVK